MSSCESLAQLGLARHVREDAQLDLRVVRGEQALPGLGDERGADLAAELRPDRDRLEVRLEVDRRPVATVWLMVVCSRPSSPMSRKWPEVGVHELRQLAPLLDHGDDLVVGANRTEHLLESVE